MRALVVFLHLDRHERGILVRAWLWLAAVSVAVRLLPFRWLERALEGRLPERGRRVALPPARLVYLADAAARRLPMRVGCLPRALVLRRLFRGERHPALLRFGVRRAGEGLEAHAWVEISGQPVGEPEDVHQRFGALAAVRPEP